MSQLQAASSAGKTSKNDSLTSSQQRLTLIAMCLSLGLSALDDTVVSVALPSLQADLSISVESLQWILNAYLLPIACLVLPIGSLGDVYGRKRVFLAGLFLFVLSSILIGLATTVQFVIAGRLLQGIGAAALLPSSLAILSDAYPNSSERAKAIGIWSGVSGLALIVGPTLGGFLIDAFGWRSIFFLNVPFGVFTFWLTCHAVSIAYSQKHRRLLQLDWLGMGLSITAIASFIAWLMSADGAVGRSPILGSVSVLGAIAFLFVESRMSCPMLPLRVFRHSAFSTVFVTNAMLLFVLVSMMFLFSLFLQQVQGYSASAAGIRFLPLNAAFIFGSIVSGYFLARFSERFVIAAGFAIASVAVFSLGQVEYTTAYGDMLPSLVLVGFGVGFTLSPLTAAGMESLTATQSGLAAALLNTSTRLGGALGIAVQGDIFSANSKRSLQRLLAEETRFGVEANAAIVAESTSHGAARPEVLHQIVVNSQQVNNQQINENLDSSLDALETVTTAIHSSFVSGLHSTLWLAGSLLLFAAVLSVVCVRPYRKEH